jgi:hypothetical protein
VLHPGEAVTTGDGTRDVPERLNAAKVRAALRDEALTRWSWFETCPVRADEAGIREGGDGWLVYSTDERAVEVYRQHHADESAALEDFLGRARATTSYFRLRAERARAAADHVLHEPPATRDGFTG